MKRLLGFLFLIAPAALGSEAFLLNIPLRFNAQQETGEVRVTLTLSAAPSGSQLVVNGTTTLNLGDSATVAGDSVAFAAAGGNDVRITYRPLSNFGADFCSAVNATEKNVPMRFAGPQDVTEYRMTTYIVAAPAAECSQPSKHTGDTPATLIPNADGVAPALSATNRGRHPFDVVLVLDKSGSMADFPPGASAVPTKAEILRSAATAFVAQWQQLDQPTMGGGEWSHDRLGVVFFDATAQPQSIAGGDPPSDFFVQRGSGNAWSAVSNDVLTLSPGSSTSIGAGINAAMQAWKSDPQHDLSLVVFTDGMQNTAPLIQPAASGFLALDPVAGFPAELRKRFVPIQTIGFGSPAQVDETLLRNIALETAGVSYIAVSGATVYDDFAQTLVALLKGNTASLGVQTHGTLTGAGPDAPQPVVIDNSPQRVVFSVQWDPPLYDALDLEVFRPGSNVPATPTSRQKTPQASLQTFDLRKGDAGTWTVRVKRGPLRETTTARLPRVPYTLNALFLEKHLDYRISLDTLHPAAGDTLRLHAVIAWDGKPLTGLPPGAVRARVWTSSAALGNLLRDARVGGGVAAPTKLHSGEIQTPYERKVATLARNGLFDRLTLKEAGTIAFKEERNGVYTATFDRTTIPGTVAFDLALDWSDARTGRVQRVERHEQYVRVKADPERTTVTASKPVGGLVTIAVTPRDRFGNYLGPGHASELRAVVKRGGKLEAEVPEDRDQTGTFVFTVTDVPAGQPPEVEIVVDRVVVGR